MLRQKPDTSVGKSLAKAFKRSRGAPRKTWYSLIKKDLEGLGIKIDESTWGTVLDCSQWKRRVSQATSI